MVDDLAHGQVAETLGVLDEELAIAHEDPRQHLVDEQSPGHARTNDVVLRFVETDETKARVHEDGLRGERNFRGATGFASVV